MACAATYKACNIWVSAVVGPVWPSLIQLWMAQAVMTAASDPRVHYSKLVSGQLQRHTPSLIRAGAATRAEGHMQPSRPNRKRPSSASQRYPARPPPQGCSTHRRLRPLHAELGEQAGQVVLYALLSKE